MKRECLSQGKIHANLGAFAWLLTMFLIVKLMPG